MLNIVSIIAAVTAISVTSPSFAEPVLWQNIEAGEAAESVRVKFPAVKGKRHHKRKLLLLEDVQKVGKCMAEVTIHHPDGVVTKVQIDTLSQQLWLKDTCTEEAHRSLLAKYGAPVDPSTNPSIEEGDLRVMTWIRDGVSIRFEFDPEGYSGWTITYEAVSETGL